jgi:hypothetical protein
MKRVVAPELLDSHAGTPASVRRVHQTVIENILKKSAASPARELKLFLCRLQL